jgi:hypothetical protein
MERTLNMFRKRTNKLQKEISPTHMAKELVLLLPQRPSPRDVPPQVQDHHPQEQDPHRPLRQVQDQHTPPLLFAQQHQRQLPRLFIHLGKLPDLGNRGKQKVQKLPRSFSTSHLACEYIFYEMHDMTL